MHVFFDFRLFEFFFPVGKRFLIIQKSQFWFFKYHFTLNQFIDEFSELKFILYEALFVHFDDFEANIVFHSNLTSTFIEVVSDQQVSSVNYQKLDNFDVVINDCHL